MTRTLWGRFFLLLLTVAAVALSAAFVVRELMTRDFRDYLEGQREDRVYWIAADAERTYEKHGGWNQEAIAEDAVWALTLGFQMRLLDGAGRVVGDTRSALASLPPGMKGRGLPEVLPAAPEGAPFVPHPLFSRGVRIGTLELQALELRDEAVFARRSAQFLLLSIVVVGGVALLLSVVASRALTRPLEELAAAAASIGRGELKTRAVVEDRGEVGSLADAFNHMAQALERLEAHRKKLLTNLAHELRTPLSAIRGELEGMMDGLLPTGRQELSSLHEETGRLRRMLDGIEELAHAQASVAALQRERVRLRPLLEHGLEMARRRAEGKQVALSIACAEDLTVDADPDRLSQVVLNLLDNAVKAVRSGGHVAVRASARAEEVLVAVEDDGVGIAAADLPFVFERFFRRSAGGLGIGLAIAKELVEAHGGRLDAVSELGHGAVFMVHLPLRAAHNSS